MLRLAPRTVVAVSTPGVAPVFTAPTSAHNGPHRTPTQAARRLVNNDIVWDDGEVDLVTYAECHGRGHSFIASNGHRVHGQFVCYVKTEGEPTSWVRMTSQPGNDYRLKFMGYL